MTGAEIAAAFMTQNDKRTWRARSVNRARNSGAGDVVHFESAGGMVSLLYNVQDGRFAVKFNKFHGAWGDYIKAIARSLFVVLNTLAGMVIECTTTDDNLTHVRWPGMPAASLDTDDLGTHLEAAGFARTHVEGLPEGVDMFVGKLPPVL
jgi:hypothetical protein